jgi:hypothetical protein
LKRPLVAKRALNHVETGASGVRRSVLAGYAALLKSYGITRVIGDRYGGSTMPGLLRSYVTLSAVQRAVAKSTSATRRMRTTTSSMRRRLRW